MNSRAQVSLPVIAGVLAIVIIILFIMILSFNVNLSIKIDKDSVPKGLDIILNYEVENGYWFSDAEKVVLKWAILNENDYLEENDTINISILKPLEKRIDNIIIDTSNLDRGQYTIWVHVDYWVLGKWQTKHLSLQFNVI